jgi:adenine-specific DNA-methyltransferase
MATQNMSRVDHVLYNLPLFEGKAEFAKTSPLPMQYLGSKSRITNWIINSIKSEYHQRKVLVDLFAGSGAVSCAAMNEFPIIVTNDIQPYSQAIQQSLFCTSREGLNELAQDVLRIDSLDVLLSNGRSDKEQLFIEENLHFRNGNLNWEDYRNYCNNKNIIEGTKESIDALRREEKHNLFVSYYANTYFGVRQCLELDALHEYANDLEPNQKTHVIAATISSMTFAVSSTTHLAQYLRPSSQQNAFKLKERRSLSIIKMVSDRLRSLSKYPMPRKKSEALNLGFEEALEKVPYREGTIVYIDPPYFKEHYSRYYHVLDTFVLYDFPYLTYNPRLGRVTEGRYREDRIVSDFGLRGKAENAFERVFLACSRKGFDAAVSYANTSLISRDSISEKARKAGYEMRILERALLHSGQGQPRNKKVTEFLFLLKGRAG